MLARPFFTRGARVQKVGGGYGGPGIVLGEVAMPDGALRFQVAHRIEGGFGHFAHIYAPSLLEPVPRWRHLVRGTLYDVIGTAGLQVAADEVLLDGTKMLVYRGDDGTLHVRSEREFLDGRFEQVGS